MYRAIEYFTDLQDNSHVYKTGDEYPRAGLEVSDRRIAELLSSDNLRGKPLIEEMVEEKRSDEVSEETPKRGRRKK